jgi:hypothetical protein
MKRILRKIIKPTSEQTVTVVSGLPRSGTSMMMKMLEAGGIPPLTDEIRTADTDNPEGYYEFERVKQLDKGDTEWLEEAQGKVVKIISALLKHLPADYQYRIIFMHRHMSEILASQRKMLAHRGEDEDKMDDAKMSALFKKHLQQVKKWIESQPNVSVLYIDYNQMLSDPMSQIERLHEFLDNSLDLEQMANVIDPDLYRNRQEQLRQQNATAG